MIRKFETKDTERVMQIWLEVNIETHHFVPNDYWLSQYQSVQEQILEADIYVYEQDKEIQGFVGMMDDYLAGIFVDKKCRSMGIGNGLLEYIKKNHPTFSLNVYQKNRRAVDFYLREGLSIVSEGIDEDTGETDYTMVWNQKETEDNELLKNLDKLHTTELGIERIKRNLSLDTDDVIDWCKTKINSDNAVVTRNGKNWYVNVDNYILTVNAYSYTIITAHKEKK